MSKRKSCERAGLFGLSLLAFSAAAAPQVMAQDDPTAAAEEEEAIVVVGSRLRRDQFTADAPIQVITQEESTRAGFVSTTEVLQSNAVTGGGAQINQLFGGLVVNGGGGVNTLGLRGFGPTSTLVLLNGRRLTPAGVRGAVGAADLNTIPSALVDRIEILKDGASSIYGSDAVAGVVNIITNRDFDGFELEAQRNITEAGGGEQSRISLSGGHEFGSLSLLGSVEYYEREAQLYRDRPWSSCPLDGIRDPVTGESFEDIDPLTGELKCWTINFLGSAGVTINTIGTATRAGWGGPGAPGVGAFNRWRPNPANFDGIGGNLDGFEGVNGGGNGFANRDTFDPEMLDVDLISPTETFNVFFSGAWDLGRHEVYGEVLFSRRESSQGNYVQLSLDYPNNPLLPAELQTGPPQNPLSTFPNPPPIGEPGSRMPAPYETQVRAFIGFGNVPQVQEVEYTRQVLGIRGDLFTDWRYDFNIYHGQNEGENIGQNFLVDRIFNSLVISPAVGGEPPELIRTIQGVDYVCTITLTNPEFGCIPAPQLNAQTIGGQLPGDWVNWVQQRLVESNRYEETAYQLVVDGPLFRLPAGPVLAAFGAEFRDAEIDNTPSLDSQLANVYNFTAGGPTRGSDSVSEFFAETEIPILRDAPFARSLTVNLSARHTDYESYGSDVTYKIGGSWEPIDDLTFRATRGTSYRAPALFEQFLGVNTGFQAGNFDPCNNYGDLDPANQVYINCDAEIGDVNFVQNNGVTIFNGGGAATDIFAETSENATIGVAWRPLRDREGLGELWLAADWFSIELNDSIAQLGAVNILNRCYGSPDPATEPTCTLITRDANNELSVNNNYINIALQESVGWDLGLRYARALFDGELTVTGNMVLYNVQDFTLFSDLGPVDNNGTLGAPEVAGDMTVGYAQGPWYLRYGVTWVGPMDDYAKNGEDPADSPFILATDDYFLHDASVQYSTDNWQLTLGVRNLFDEDPPPISSVSAFFNTIGQIPLFSGYDFYGRQFFVNVSTRF